MDIPLAIKLIRISTLNNMIFDLKYLKNHPYNEKNIIADIIKVCGGIIFEEINVQNKDKVYLVISRNIYETKNKRKEIKKDLNNNPNYFLINETFILDTYYFMTNLKDNIKDPEYNFDKLE